MSAGFKTQTQLKFSGTRKAESSAVSSSPSRRPAGGGETFELNFLKGSKSPVTVVDDMTYRRSARIIAAVDIAYSTFLLFAQLLNLISGAAHESTKARIAQSQARTALHPDRVPEEPTLSHKQKEYIAVLAWMGLFAVCILQLVVAGALCGGTYERDGRKTIRNCRIWVVTTIFLVFLLVLKLLTLSVFGEVEAHLVDLGFLVGEISFRVVGLVFIRKFIQELAFEFADDGDVDDGMDYEPLCASPLPQLKSSLSTTNHV